MIELEGSEASPDDHLQLVDALRAAGAREGAARALDRARGRLGPLASLDSAAIDLAVQGGQRRRALAIIDQQIAASPRPAYWLVQRGRVLTAARLPRQARKAYQAALEVLDQLEAGERFTPALSALRAEAEAHAGPPAESAQGHRPSGRATGRGSAGPGGRR
jgi:tetratricopeptide (TPR) repeat protein